MAIVHPAMLAEVAAFAVPALGTFARRGFSSNRRKIGDAVITSSAPSTPLTIIASVPVAQWVRSDLGVTLGGTLLASGTTPPVITLTGSFLGPTPTLRVACSGGGALGAWTGAVSYDGGATIAQVFTSGATQPLVGLGNGVTLNIAAGTASVDNVWLATVATLADQSGNGRDFTQGTASAQPTYIANTALNLQSILAFDGVAQFLSSAWVRAAPATTNQWISAIVRQVSWTAARQIISDSAANSYQALRQVGASPAMTQINPTSVNSNNALALATWGRAEVLFTGSVSDYLKLIANKVTGASAGNNAGTGTRLGSGNGASFAACLILETIVTLGAPTAGEISNIDTYYTNRYGVGLV